MKANLLRLLLLPLLCSSAVRCTPESARATRAEEEAQPLSQGSTDELNTGRVLYRRTCRACHGENGDGTGPSAFGLRPPPRDFTRGIFKFTSGEAGSLPTDDDLRRTIQKGLAGTAMIGWSLTDTELDSVIAYLKTFSARWRKESVGPAIVGPPDPWATDDAGAVTRGRALYHVTTGCSSCHPSYATRSELPSLSRELGSSLTPTPRESAHLALPKESEFWARETSPAAPLRILPPNFLTVPVKSGAELPDLFRTIAAGVGGTAMPSWHAVPPYTDPRTGERWQGDADVWALAHYVRWLAVRRDRPEGVALLRALDNDR